MKKIFLLIPLFVITLLLSACSKQLFVEAKPLQNNSLVYIYVAEDSFVSDIVPNHCYSISVDNKTEASCIKLGEYMEIELKSAKIELNVARSDIEKHSLTLLLEKNKNSYVKIQSHSNSFAEFTLQELKADLALPELKYTQIGTPVKENQKRMKRVEHQMQNINSFSKSDELEKAYKLKEKGILSQEEFNKLKSEILAK